MDTATKPASATDAKPKKAVPKRPAAVTKTPDEWAGEEFGDEPRPRNMPFVPSLHPEHQAVCTLRGWNGPFDRVTQAQYRAGLRAYRAGPA